MVQVAGDGVMLGYLNNPEANAKTFTDDRWSRIMIIMMIITITSIIVIVIIIFIIGIVVVIIIRWMKTGDIGHITEDGTVFISDRLKELIKVKTKICHLIIFVSSSSSP